MPAVHCNVLRSIAVCSVHIKDDSRREDTESFTVRLDSTMPGVFIAANASLARVFIHDPEDGMCWLSFYGPLTMPSVLPFCVIILYTNEPFGVHLGSIH